MMGILDKLYDNEYFGIVLFVIIAFLILLFIVILFFGVNDAKKTEKKNENEDNDLEADAFMKFDDTVKLDIPVETVTEEIKEESNEKVDSKPVEEVKVIKKPNIDLDSLIHNSNVDEDENIELPKVKQPKDIDSESYDLK